MEREGGVDTARRERVCLQGLQGLMMTLGVHAFFGFAYAYSPTLYAYAYAYAYAYDGFRASLACAHCPVSCHIRPLSYHIRPL